jgi:hypothetical protein
MGIFVVYLLTRSKKYLRVRRKRKCINNHGLLLCWIATLWSLCIGKCNIGRYGSTERAAATFRRPCLLLHTNQSLISRG